MVATDYFGCYAGYLFGHAAWDWFSLYFWPSFSDLDRSAAGDMLRTSHGLLHDISVRSVLSENDVAV